MDRGAYTNDAVRPTGTVTFLFTDVVGSTPLWDRFPELMAEALAVHDRVIKRSISDHDGRVFSTAGDSYAAAFATASAAWRAWRRRRNSHSRCGRGDSSSK